MTFQDEPMEDVLPDETGIEPADRSLWDRLGDAFYTEGNVGADDDDPPEEISPWQ